MSYAAQLTQTDIALSRLIEVAKRRKSVNALMPLIDTIDAQIGALFVKQGNALVRALNPLRKLIKEDAVSDQFDQIFDSATLATSTDMLDVMRKGYSSALLLGGKDQLSEVGIKVSFSLDNPRAAQYIKVYGADQITGIDATTRTDIRNLLRAGIENGDSYDTIAAAIKARYKYFATGAPQQHIRSRAHLIAVTECGNGYQAGNFSSMQAVQDTGIKMLKHWLTIGDGRVSEGCLANQAQDWIPITSEHTSGHMHPLRFPGCRCVEQYKRDSATKAIAVAKPTAIINLTSAEKEIRNQDFETAYAFDKKGNLLFKTDGTKNTVAINKDQLPLLQGATLTHNHPSSKSFSLEDIKLAIENNIGELRAVARTGTIYVFRLNDNSIRKFDVKAILKVKERIQKDLIKEVRKGTLTLEGAESLIHHRLWTQAAKTYKWDYSRILESK